MSWPSSAAKNALRRRHGRPKQARAAFASNADKVNQIINHVSSLAQTFLAETTAGGMRSTLDAQQTTNSLTELTTVDGANDFLPIYDASAGTTKKVKPDNLGGVFSESFTNSEQTITAAG